ncbi:hemin receptor [Tenacibaculum sp. 190524A02b]|uniref:Long-chain fatty acid transport protein n=1 Tax=Tenacibaculum vairaonense TaxID=3137860 RepID=A0ABP1FE33_9FLAO
MKRFFTLAIAIASSFSAYSQSLNYNDLGILFSQDDNYGTARYEAMSGAFGALGGDVSSLGINPAGAAVSKKSSASITIGNRNTDITALYYGNSSATQNDYFNMTQAGGILAFDTAYQNSEWNRFAFSFNYRIKKDYNSFYSVNGNSEFLYNTEHFNDTNTPKRQFEGAIGQRFSEERLGNSSVFNIGFSAVHQNKLFVGASLNFHDLNFNRIGVLREENDDANGNVLNARNTIDSYIQGSGFSIGLGFIYKLDQNLRLGLAYETPTWYQEISEDYKNQLVLSEVRNLGINGGTDLIDELYVYRFKTNSRITASGAYIFGKKGLISVDYTYKDYQNIKYRENSDSFIEANQGFASDYRSTHALNVGAEWRFDRMSLRGGYHYEKNPNLIAALGGNTNKDNIKGFSAGLGYNFGNIKVDLSYRKSENIEYNTLYQTGDINLTNDTSRISGTLTINL